jgi:hypothetical protein
MWTAVVRPALVDRKGYVLFLGTPFGRNHFHKLYERAKEMGTLTMLYRASETGVVPADELEAARQDMDADLYAQEFECSFEAAIRGAYYARQLEQARAEGRIKPLVWEPQAPVDTWWDLGWSDATAILFTQTIGREIRVLDYHEATHSTASDLAKLLLTKPYIYGKHHLPHDAGHATQGGQGLSMQTQLNRLGVRPSVILGQNEVLHGINQARQLFSRCWFDAVKCTRLIDALGTYRQEWDVKRQDFKAEPYHDWSSHGADAFRYLAIGHKDHTDGLGRPRGPQQRSYDTTYSPFDRVGARQTQVRMGGTAWG